MTECERYQELISRMADEELTKSERAALSAHMEHCSQCNAMYAVFSNLSEIIGQDAEPLPEGLHENIMADIRRSALKQQNIKERRRFAIPKPFRNVVAAAACAAVVIFAAKGMLNEKMNDTSAMSASEAAAAAAPVATAAATPQPTPAIPPSAAGSAPKAQAPEVTAEPASPEVQSSGREDDIYSGGSAVDNSENRSAPGNAPAAAPASAPAPTQAPSVVETETPRAVPTPAPTPVPTAVPDASAQSVPEESSAPAAVSVEPEESEEPVGRFRSFLMNNVPIFTASAPAEAAVESSAPADGFASVQSVDEPAEAVDAGSSCEVIFVEVKGASKRGELMQVLQGIAASPAPVGSAKPEKPCESPLPERPVESALPSPSPSAAVAEDALPAQDPDFMYEILFPQCKEKEEDFMSVCVFGEDVYWVVFSDDGGEQVFRAECSVKEFEDFIKPFVITDASPSPDVSPAAQETPCPVQ